MLDKDLIVGIQNCFMRDMSALSFKDTKKYKNKDFKFEYVDEPYEYYTDDYGRKLRKFIGDPNFIYDFDSTKGQYIKILDSEESFVSFGHGEYKNTTFDYKIYNIFGYDFIDMFKIVPHSSVLELPDEINGIPVCIATLYREIDKSQIGKIILGNNIICIRSFTKFLLGLNDVEIKPDYNGNRESLINILSQFVNYSTNEVSIKLNYNKDLNFINNCILSKNGKELFLICSKNKAIIPDTVEIITSTAFILKFKTSGTVKWPASLKIIQDLNIKDNDFLKIISNNPLNNNLEVLSSSTILLAINNDHLIIPKKITDITPMAIYKHNSFSKVIVNENFSVVDDMLLNKDKTIIYSYFGKNKRNTLTIPKTVIEIRNTAFSYRNDIKNIILESNHEKLIGYFEGIAKYSKIKIIVKPQENQNNNLEFSAEVKYVKNKNKVAIANSIKLDKLIVDINEFPDTEKKIFVITKECANIKELIIPEGVTEIKIDPLCFTVTFNTEIIELPSTCKFMQLLNQFSDFKNLMMLVVNPEKKPRWTVHKVPFIIACKSNASMPKGVQDYDYYGYGSGIYNVLNEITYIKNYDSSRLITTNEAYYYIYKLSKKELGLLKVKGIDEFSNPKTIGQYKVTKEYDYCYSKYKQEEQESIEGSKSDLHDEEVFDTEDDDDFDEVDNIGQDSIIGKNSESIDSKESGIKNINDTIDEDVVNDKNAQIKSKRNTGYTAKNETILSASDFLTAIDLASNNFSNNQSEEVAIEYSKKMKIALLYDDAIYAKDEHDKPVSATFNKKKGVQFSCYCDEYKTKANPCIHIRALYYLLKSKKESENNNKKEKKIVEKNVSQTKKRNNGYTVKSEKILACSDLLSAIDLATNDFSKNHDEQLAIDYAKQMIITLQTKTSIRACNKQGMYTTVILEIDKSIEFTCGCDEHKTKTNPCHHIRALYYLLKKQVEETNYTEQIKDITNKDIIKEENTEKVNNDLELNENSKTITYHKKFDFDKLDSLFSIFGLVSFILLIVAIICSYLTTATLTMYPIYQGEIVGSALYTEFNIGKKCGFFFVLMYLGTVVSLISKFAITDKQKEFIPFVISCICSFIAGITFASCMSKYDYVNDITNIPYQDIFQSIEESCVISGPGGVVTFLFIFIAIVFSIIAFIKYKKSN